MLTIIEKCVLLCVVAKAWEIEKDNKKGTAYSGLIYTNKDVVRVKLSEDVYKEFKEMEMVEGKATVEIKKSIFNGTEKTTFELLKFEY